MTDLYAAARASLQGGDPYACLAAYARALALAPDPVKASEAVASLERVGTDRPGAGWARRLLRVALDSQRLGVGGGLEPVVMLAGGSSAQVEEHMEGYRDLLLAAFRDFRGTIVSGGTRGGIGGLAGDIRAEYGGRIATVGYIPEVVPAGAVVDSDPDRYDRLCVTDGHSFSPIQPVQSWIDLVARGVDPGSVGLLGLNGGAVAGAEYQIALALGARTGLVEMSGGAADKLLRDPDWAGAPGLVRLRAEVGPVRAFVESLGGSANH